jgi:ankyrin repeat protein
MSNRDRRDGISISRQPYNKVEYIKLQAQIREMELKHQMQIREMELVNQIEQLELHHQNEKQQMEIENRQMEIDSMKRLLHQQQLIGTARTVDIDIEQDDIEPQLDQQDDYLNPFHPEFCSNLDSFCDSALKEDIILNSDPSPKLIKVIVNKAIEEKEYETKRISKMLPQQVQFVKKEKEQLMLAVQLSEEDEQSLQQSVQAGQQTHKLSRLKLHKDCQSFIKPAPLDDDPIITQFRPVTGQLKLNEANIKRIDPQSGETILHNYCQHINTTPHAIFRYLIEMKGGKITIQSKHRGTPIQYALCYFNSNEGGDIHTLMYLLNQEGIDVNTKSITGRTRLHHACENIDRLPLDIIKYLIENKGSEIDCLDKDGNTPLHLLMTYLSTKLDSNVSQAAEYLIQKGIPINHKNSSHFTVLDKLSQHSSTHPLTYGVLIKNGAKLGKDC